MSGLVIIPSRGEDWTELDSIPLALARNRAIQGRVFRKHILTRGTLLHPQTGEPINIDDAFVAALQQNFADGVADIVQVPLANAKNEHSESPRDNIGEVVGIEDRDGRVYALIDARDEDAAGKLGKTYLGASALLSTNYTNTATGSKAGPTLLHVAVTNRPYVTNLEPYEEVLAATRTDDTDGETVVLTLPEDPVADLTKDELIAALKDKHGIDVAALQAQPPAAQGDGLPALTAALTAALRGNDALGLSGRPEDTITMEDITGAVVELSRHNSVLAGEVQAMRRQAAETEVDKLIDTGHVLPKQRNFAVTLALTNREQFAEFVPDQPVIPLGVQSGVGEVQDSHASAEQEAEVVRLTKLYTEDVVGSRNGRSRAS